MRCLLSLLAVVVSAAGAKIRPPSGLYLPPTAEFGAAPSQVNQVSQEPIVPASGGRTEVSHVSSGGSGCCSGSTTVTGPQAGSSGLIHSISDGHQSSVQTQPGLSSQSDQYGPSSQTSQSSPSHLSSQSVFSQSSPSSQFGVSGQFPSSQSDLPSQFPSSQSSQSVQSSVGPSSVSSEGHAQSGYYDSGSQSAVVPVVPGALPSRPSNMFLDNPSQFESHQFTSQVISKGPAPPNYQANVFLNGQPIPAPGNSGTIREIIPSPLPAGPGPQVISGRPLPAGPAGKPAVPSGGPLPDASRSQTSFNRVVPVQQPASPSVQLLNRHPGQGGSGPLGHQLRTCSTSLVCVPMAMCNPYTGFVRGGLLFEPKEPTLQPTVALDRCTELKDGGTGDGVCCQMPHINDPWPRDP